MKFALVEPYVSLDSLKSYADKPEPAHLLGMYNLLKKLGCDVVLLDAYSRRFSVTDLVEWLEAQAVTHVGLTVYDYPPCLTYVQQLFNRLSEDICTIIGGPGPNYCTDRMIRLLKPNWLVKGAGEQTMVDLVQSEFSTERLSYAAARIWQTIIVSADSMPLDEIPFERPYNLDRYDFQASPRIQTGCIGQCIFCSGAYQKKFDYITKNKAEQLFDHLVNQKNADVLAPTGPDFTAVPQRANDLLHILVESGFRFRSFRPGVRLDTISKAIELDPKIWKRLSTTYEISLESSIESFSLSRIKRLGKNISLDFFENILTNLTKILETCDCKIVLGRIAIDPTITIDEFILDCNNFRKLLRKFKNHITVGGMLMNEFVPLFGTPATEYRGHDNLWLRDLLDPTMRRLRDKLLNNNQFKKWCNLAAEIQNFSERNMVFEEILRVAEEQAKGLKSLKGYCSKNCYRNSKKTSKGDEIHMCQSVKLDPSDIKSVVQHLVCSDKLLHRRIEFASNIVEACATVRHFANLNEWHEYMWEPLFTSIEIFATQKELWHRIRYMTRSIEKQVPTDGLSAAIISDHLMAVTPEEYKRLRPEYARTNKAWSKLLAHEMFHQLHIRLVGTEEKMGPKWFYEGFAMHAAGQRFGKAIMSIEEAVKATRAESRGSYAKYIAAFEFFLKRIDLNLMLQQASEQDFEAWLISHASASKD